MCMTKIFRQFINPTITSVCFESQRQHRKKALHISITSSGVNELLHIVDPRESNTNEFKKDEMIARICREWAELCIRTEMTAGSIRYGLDFVADELSDRYSLRAKDCTIEAVPTVGGGD